MLKASVAKTASAPKRLLLVLGGLTLLVLIALSLPRGDIQIGTGRYLAEKVSGQQLEKGLSERDSLGSNRVMLFQFAQPDTHCMWMKNMKFSIDIIWLDEARQVVHLKQNVTPDTYPQSFCPPKPALYVVEANSGTIQKTGLKLGDTVNF